MIKGLTTFSCTCSVFMVNSITKYTNLTLLQGREFLTKSTGVMAILMASGDKLWSLADVYMKQFRYEHLLHPEDIKNVSQVEWFSSDNSQYAPYYRFGQEGHFNGDWLVCQTRQSLTVLIANRAFMCSMLH